MSDKVDITELTEEEMDELIRNRKRSESKYGSRIGDSLDGDEE